MGVNMVVISIIFSSILQNEIINQDITIQINENTAIANIWEGRFEIKSINEIISFTKKPLLSNFFFSSEVRVSMNIF